MVSKADFPKRSRQSLPSALNTRKPSANTVLVVISYANLVQDAATRADFWQIVNETHPVMAKSPGLLGHSLRHQLHGNEVLIMMIWKDQDSLTTFVRGKTGELLSQAYKRSFSAYRTCCVELPRDQVPLTWNDALALFGR